MVGKEFSTPEALREAITEVFNTMIFMDVNPQAEMKEYLADDPCIMGSITFTGKFEGALTIRCSTSCAKAITMNLLAMEDEEEIQPFDIPDAIGEVGNMTMGMLKSRLYDQLGEISISVPTVVSGTSLTNELRAGEVKLSTTVGVGDQYCLEVNLIYMDPKVKDE